MKSIITILLILLLLFSCKEEQQNSATFIDFSIPIHVMNQEGNNLLDEDTEGHYNTDSIRIYYVINGKSTMFYKPSADYPYGYVIGNNPGIGNFFNLNANVDATEQPTVTYIQWKQGTVDTLKSEIVRNGTRIGIAKLWYNDQPVEDWLTPGFQYVEVVK